MFPARLAKQSTRSKLPSTMRSTSSRPFARPRLPVPDLRKTLDRYLASLEPLLLEDEARNGTPFEAAYALRHKWADEFERGVGRVCQERLKGQLVVCPPTFVS